MYTFHVKLKFIETNHLEYLINDNAQALQSRLSDRPCFVVYTGAETENPIENVLYCFLHFFAFHCVSSAVVIRSFCPHNNGK